MSGEKILQSGLFTTQASVARGSCGLLSMFSLCRSFPYSLSVLSFFWPWPKTAFGQRQYELKALPNTVYEGLTNSPAGLKSQDWLTVVSVHEYSGLLVIDWDEHRGLTNVFTHSLSKHAI